MNSITGQFIMRKPALAKLSVLGKFRAKLGRKAHLGESILPFLKR
jgi:hypothetical protein